MSKKAQAKPINEMTIDELREHAVKLVEKSETMETELKQLRGFKDHVTEAREKVREAQQDYDDCDTEKKKAKDRLDAANAVLAEAVDRDPKQGELPFDADAKPGETKSLWRETSLNSLELEPGVRKKVLAHFNPPTFGSLFDYIEAGNKLVDVKDLTDAEAGAVQKSLATWYRDNPTVKPPAALRVQVAEASAPLQPWMGEPIDKLAKLMPAPALASLKEANLTTLGVLDTWMVDPKHKLQKLDGFTPDLADDVRLAIAEIKSKGRIDAADQVLDAEKKEGEGKKE